MNYRIIKRTLGWLLLFETAFFCVPIVTALVYGEKEIYHFLFTMAGTALLGGLCLIGKPKDDKIFAKEGIVITASSWILLSLFGAIPLYTTGGYPTYIDALFETVSGFTTTGSSVLSSDVVASLPKCILMWRSFTHWIGGMGVLVFIMVFLPLCGGGRNMNIMKAESPGPSVGKLLPKMRSTARVLYLIYTSLTVLEFVMLVFDMPVFDAINASFATAGTGGFSIRADGFAGYSSYSQIVVTVFMVLFSVNFASYFFILCGKWKEAFTTEVRTFLIIVLSAITLITLNLTLSNVLVVGEAIKHSAFSVSSIISTTGFVTENFDMWPAFSKTVLVLCMFIGACAGSTGGGIKVSRLVIMFKGVRHETQRLLHPKQIKKITMDGKVVEHETVRSVNNYLIAFIFIFVLSLLVISLDGQDLVTNFTAVSATINNIGPGLGVVGPVGNFGDFSILSKVVFIFDMLIGRLEIFPMILLFAPSTWRK
ncbi:MAG: TrkH family potassium uptake protein [Clostridiales bacterium]|nr:TrkH family potassium uptake protein [Clostridiales bacterium]